ncbi:hypothetical protein J6590_091210 [Homalodisca vitripennis]|nr:hypothetical protein J6590_091210 [Homalodisca vitripennis]
MKYVYETFGSPLNDEFYDTVHYFIGLSSAVVTILTLAPSGLSCEKSQEKIKEKIAE